MENKPHAMHELTRSIEKPPKDKEVLTTYKLIQSGQYTDEELMTTIETWITEGVSYRDICKRLKIRLSSLSSYLAKEGHFTRAKVALKISADYFADMSIKVLKDVAEDRTAIMKARELSAAYRWMARVRDVSKYGERLDVTSDGDKIVVLSLGTGTKPPETEETNYIDVTDNG